jgi:hypothetical protein
MLELTIEQISMGQSAVDKSAALHLLAGIWWPMAWSPRVISRLAGP